MPCLGLTTQKMLIDNDDELVDPLFDAVIFANFFLLCWNDWLPARLTCMLALSLKLFISARYSWADFSSSKSTKGRS